MAISFKAKMGKAGMYKVGERGKGWLLHKKRAKTPTIRVLYMVF